VVGSAAATGSPTCRLLHKGLEGTEAWQLWPAMAVNSMAVAGLDDHQQVAAFLLLALIRLFACLGLRGSLLQHRRSCNIHLGWFEYRGVEMHLSCCVTCVFTSCLQWQRAVTCGCAAWAMTSASRPSTSCSRSSMALIVTRCALGMTWEGGGLAHSMLSLLGRSGVSCARAEVCSTVRAVMAAGWDSCKAEALPVTPGQLPRPLLHPRGVLLQGLAHCFDLPKPVPVIWPSSPD